MKELAQKKEKSLFTDAFYFVLGNTAAAVIGVVTSIVLARLLGPENNGIITSALLIPNLIISIASQGIRQSSIFLTGKKIFSDTQMISSLFYIFLILSGAGLLITILYFLYAFDFSRELTMISISLICVYLPIRIFCNYLNSFMIGKNFFKIVNFVKWSGAILYLALVIFFTGYLKAGNEGVYLSVLLLSFLTLLFFLFILFRRKITTSVLEILKFHKQSIRTIVSYGLLFGLALVIIQLNLRVDILFLKYYWDNTEVGFYSIAVAMAEIIWQFPLAIAVVIIGKTASSKNLFKTAFEIGLLFRITLPLTLIMGIILYFIIPMIIPVFYGAQFSPCIKMVQAIVPGIFFFSLMIILSAYIIGRGKPQAIIYIGFPSLIINMVLNMFLIPHWGGIGAAWATDISYSFAFFATMVYLLKNSPLFWTDFFIIRKNDFKSVKLIILNKNE